MNGSLDVQGTQQRPLTERIDDRIRSGDRHRHFSHSQRLEIKIQTTVQKIQKSGPTARESPAFGDEVSRPGSRRSCRHLYLWRMPSGWGSD